MVNNICEGKFPHHPATCPECDLHPIYCDGSEGWVEPPPPAPQPVDPSKCKYCDNKAPPDMATYRLCPQCWADQVARADMVQARAGRGEQRRNREGLENGGSGAFLTNG